VIIKEAQSQLSIAKGIKALMLNVKKKLKKRSFSQAGLFFICLAISAFCTINGSYADLLPFLYIESLN